MSEPVKISIIIPVYNEGDNLRRLLYALGRLDYNPEYYEVIIADSGNDHLNLPEIAPNCRLIISQKGRAHQMNEGTTYAEGQVLFFLHGDSLIHGEVLRKIDSAIKKGAKWGCLRVTFLSGNILMKICGFLSNLRVSLRKIAFGDQGIFIQKNLFNEIGGFEQIPIMEDYRMSMVLKNLSIPPVQINSKVFTSARRFEKNGMWHTILNMQKCQFWYRHGIPAERIAEFYR